LVPPRGNWTRMEGPLRKKVAVERQKSEESGRESNREGGGDPSSSTASWGKRGIFMGKGEKGRWLIRGRKSPGDARRRSILKKRAKVIKVKREKVSIMETGKNGDRHWRFPREKKKASHFFDQKRLVGHVGTH